MSGDEQDDESCDATELTLSEADPSTRPHSAVPKLLEGSAVLVFLEPYGFAASTAMDWQRAPPELSITVSGHTTAEQHTLYQVECSLALDKEPLRWRAALRLKHIRKGLHDVVKPQLGSSYPTYFSRVPFAHRGRPAGTTARLDAWCRRLAYCINAKLLPPVVAAAVLRLTGVPDAPAPVSSPNTSPNRVSQRGQSSRPASDDTSSPSCSSGAGPSNERQASVPSTGYSPAKYKALDLPHVDVSRIARVQQVTGPPATDDVSAAVLGELDDEDTESEDDDPADAGADAPDPVAACADGGEGLRAGQEESPEWPANASLEGTSTCTGGTGGGPTDSDSSGSAAEDSGEDGAARVGEALREARLGEEELHCAPGERSKLARRLSERRKIVDPQAAITSGNNF